MKHLLLLTALLACLTGCQLHESVSIGNWCAEDCTPVFDAPGGYEWKKQCECRVGLSSVRNDSPPTCRNCNTPWLLKATYTTFDCVVDVCVVQFDGEKWVEVPEAPKAPKHD